jgi:hypothetical protein
MKYIFVSGAPGSKWSSVVKNIYYSPDVDSSDYSEARTYRHDATGKMELLHMGVYWGPAMEFGDHFERLDQYTQEQNEAEFDAPFSGTGVRIIKSHVFGYHIDYIKTRFCTQDINHPDYLKLFGVDQGAHMLTYLCLACIINT